VARGVVGWLPAGPWSPSGYQCGSFAPFRREKFTVDERGYRNLPAEGKARMILFGSSFSLGLALNDEDTLSAQLSRQLGYTIYNASDVLSHSLTAGPVSRAAQAVNMEKG
jgi:hypothetical protein